MARLRNLAGVQVTAGIQSAEGAATEDGVRLVDIAAANEFGTDRIPSRPWLRTALDTQRVKWSALAGKVVAARGSGERDGAKELRTLGVVMVGDCKESLLDGEWAPNAPYTIAQKGSDQPLIDTGRMNQSQRAAVEMPGEAPIVVG